MDIKRGDIVVVDLNPTKGSEQGKIRPSVVLQNDVGNRHSPTTIVAPLTSSYDKVYPVNVEVKAEDTGLEKDSVILLNQIVTVDKEERIRNKIGTIPSEKEEEMDRALKISLGLEPI
ncbi:MAG: type II toxin-antitoxin system PemK/MazF family toxin [Candidatus Nanohaloarchaeota archaeon QJJ-9]|nr:type II toxin-antitoxin system PemK/MazF family toxin [Candidatus Nanohaloarchaeota archaeon QJJ-9]